MNLLDIPMPEAVLETLREIRSLVFGEPAQALKLARPIAIAGGGPGAAAQVYMGDVLAESRSRRRLEDAIRHFRAALKFDKSWARAWEGLGRAQFRLGRLVEAERTYARAVALLNAEAQQARQRWHDEQKRHRELYKLSDEPALEDLYPATLDEISTVDADTVRALVDCAATLCELRQLRGAVLKKSPIDESVLEWAASEPEFLDELGGGGMDLPTWTHFHSSWAALRAMTGRVDEAVKGLRKAVRADQFQTDGAELAAELLDAAGDVRGAVAELKRSQRRWLRDGDFLPERLVRQLVEFFFLLGNEAAAVKLIREQERYFERRLSAPRLQRSERAELKRELQRCTRDLSDAGRNRLRRQALRRLTREPQYAELRAARTAAPASKA